MAFDPTTRRTRILRLKENADDYRHFPDPDLIPLLLSDEQIERVRASLPELAEQKCARFQREHGLSAYDAQQLTASRPLADFFEKAAAAHGNPKTVANWMLRDLRETLAALELEIEATRLTPGMLAGLMTLVDQGITTARSARELLPVLVREGGDPAALVRERGLETVSDAGVLEAAVTAVIAENAENAERYRSGEEKVLNFLMGQVMRRTGGKASPAQVRELLARKLGGKPS
jgi:aspartyl-tRNA(Asn)/glutamyl-tRNA(Gln) amidotransferase subunit B